jgi:hypothetical protein
MRGLDGNYMNMQGDISARLQTASLAEQNLQQARVQVQADDSLRKLREKVMEPQAGSSSSGLGEVKDYPDGQPGEAYKKEPKDQHRKSSAGETNREDEKRELSFHIDTKV